MATSLNDLDPRTGQRIRSWWKLVKAYLRRYELRPGAGTRLVQTPDGTTVIADGGRKAWPCRFRVRVTGLAARVGAGLLAGKAPTLSGVPIDGLDAEGLPTLTVPELTLKRFPVENGARSWVCVRVLAAKPEVTEIVHAATPDGRPAGKGAVDEATKSLARGGAAVQEDGYVYQAIAVVNWEGEAVRGVVQCVTMDLGLGWVKREDGTPGRAFFWAV
jgi:hypothetical protein